LLVSKWLIRMEQDLWASTAQSVPRFCAWGNHSNSHLFKEWMQSHDFYKSCPALNLTSRIIW
jgi:hypothetical protein